MGDRKGRPYGLCALAPPNASPARRLAPAPTAPGRCRICHCRGKSDSLLGPKVAPFEYAFQHGHVVTHDAVHAEVEQAFHLRLFVDRPDLHRHAARVGGTKERGIHHRNR